MILFSISLTGNGIGIFRNDIFNFLFILLSTLLTYICGIFANVLVFLLCKKELSGNLLGIILFAFFMLTWIPISVHAMVSRNTVWVPIKHGN